MFLEKTEVLGMPALVGGSGEILLFLHGFLSCKESFIKQLSFFENYFKVVAIDLSGFGQSGDLPYPYSLDDYVREIKKLIDFYGQKVNVVAHSFGGRIAIKLCAKNKNLVKRLVLVGSAGLKPKRSIRYYCKRIGYKVFKRILPLSVLEEKFFSKDYINLSLNMKKSFKLITNEFLDNRLKDIDTVTLIVWGKYDKETPLYMAQRLNENIKNSRLYVIDKAGHFSYIEKSNEFNYVVKEFLKE